MCGEQKISDSNRAILPYEYVLGLDVAMKNASAVRGDNRVTHLEEQLKFG